MHLGAPLGDPNLRCHLSLVAIATSSEALNLYRELWAGFSLRNSAKKKIRLPFFRRFAKESVNKFRLRRHLKYLNVSAR